MTHTVANLTVALAAACAAFSVWVLLRSVNISPEWMTLRRQARDMWSAARVSADDAERLGNEAMHVEALRIVARTNLVSAKLAKRPPRDELKAELRMLESEVLLDMARTDLDRLNARLYDELIDTHHDADNL